MTAPNDNRLQFLRDTTSREQGLYTAVNCTEFVSILDELMQHRAERPKLQDENLTLRSDHDRAMEIVGERIGEIVERLEAIENVDLKGGWNTLGQARRNASPPPFPTGAATTVDEALAAVPPVAEQDDGPPRRGDRVRLSEALSRRGHRVPAGWYDVHGRETLRDQSGDPWAVQIKIGTRALPGLPGGAVEMVYVGARYVKEVRRGAAQLDN